MGFSSAASENNQSKQVVDFDLVIRWLGIGFKQKVWKSTSCITEADFQGWFGCCYTVRWTEKACNSCIMNITKVKEIEPVSSAYTISHLNRHMVLWFTFLWHVQSLKPDPTSVVMRNSNIHCVLKSKMAQ